MIHREKKRIGNRFLTGYVDASLAKGIKVLRGLEHGHDYLLPSAAQGVQGRIEQQGLQSLISKDGFYINEAILRMPGKGIYLVQLYHIHPRFDGKVLRPNPEETAHLLEGSSQIEDRDYDIPTRELDNHELSVLLFREFAKDYGELLARRGIENLLIDCRQYDPAALEPKPELKTKRKFYNDSHPLINKLNDESHYDFIQAKAPQDPIQDNEAAVYPIWMHRLAENSVLDGSGRPVKHPKVRWVRDAFNIKPELEAEVDDKVTTHITREGELVNIKYA